jgi:PAS domain S-box-containing protein
MKKEAKKPTKLEHTSQEETLKEQDYLLRKSQYIARIGSYILDIQSNIWTSSEVLDEIFGIDADEEKTLMSWDSFVHPDQKDEMLTYFLQSVIKEKRPFDKEYQIVRKNDHQVRWVWGKGELIFDKNGNPIQMLGTIQDITEHKNIETKLMQNEERLKQIVNSSGIWVWEVDKEGLYTYVSPMEESILGYKPDEVEWKKHFYDFFTHDVKSELTKLAFEMFSKKETFRNLENPNLHKDGHVVILETNGFPILDEKGDLVGYRGADKDITERKLAQEALLKSNEFNESLLRTIPFGIDIVDQDGNVLFMSENLLRNFDIDTIGRKCWEFYKDDKTQCLDCPLKMDIAIGETSSIETDNILNGRSFQITHTGMLYIGKKAMLEIFQEITDSREIEKKVKLLAHSLESISECISITDINDIFLYVNKSFLQTYGYSEKELIGKHVSILRSPTAPEDQLIEVLTKAREGSWRGELINKRKDGTLFPVFLSTSVIKNESEDPIALIGVAMDITETKKNREELIASKEKAEEMNRLKSNFLANMSHELRTPMIGILGYAEVLVEESRDTLTKDAASIIYKSGHRLMNTLNMILNLSRIEAGKLNIDYKRVDVIKIVFESCKLFEEEAFKKSLFLRVESKCVELELDLDELMFREIIDNLINNALKFTLHGGVKVEIFTEISASGTWAVINIRDTGIGIPKENQSAIWEEFRQISEGLGRSFEGTGLGLTLTKKFVELMKGTITFDSQIDVGSVFTLKFPVLLSKEVGNTTI